MKKYAADFETTTVREDCRVWAYGYSDLSNPKDNVIMGTDLDEFMDFALHDAKCKKKRFYFHNMKFDGEFILIWLLTHGYKWINPEPYIKDPKDPESKTQDPWEDHTFTTLITDMGQFYQIEVCEKVGNKRYTGASFWDSYKLIPLSIEKMGPAFGMKYSKGEIDYTKPRKRDHILTDEEKSYLSRDVLILKNGLNSMFQYGLKKMTIGACALDSYKKFVKGNFDKWFPKSFYHNEMKTGYRGGWTYANPKTTHKIIEGGLILDVNSMYPSILRNEVMPYGDPIIVDRTHDPNNCDPDVKMLPGTHLWVAKCFLYFDIKENHLPSIQLKMNPYYASAEYQEHKAPDDVEPMIITSVDYEIIRQQYDISVQWWWVAYFKGQKGMFTKFIDHWYEMKVQAGKDGNKSLRQIAKLILNNIYGKFGTKPQGRLKQPYLKEDGSLGFHTLGWSEKPPIYLPVAMFTTAYGRKKIISTAQALYDRFLYSDTDSIHISGFELPTDILEIDKHKLGAFDYEAKIIRGKYCHAKCYIEHIIPEGSTKIKRNVVIAGLPSRNHYQVTIKNIDAGIVIKNKLTIKHVPGGQLLEPTTFEIKKGKFK